MKKWIFFDLLIVFLVTVTSALVANEIRADGISLVPSYLEESCYKMAALSAFQNKMGNSSCLFFDARPHDSYEADHPSGALNFPASQFDFFYGFYLDDTKPDFPILIYGRTLSRRFDLELAHHLCLKGHKNVTVLF